MGRIVFGVILGLILAPVALLVWFKWGHPPVAVADPPLPMERQITQVPLSARIDRDMPGNPPVQADEASLTAGGGGLPRPMRGLPRVLWQALELWRAYVSQRSSVVAEAQE